MPRRKNPIIYSWVTKPPDHTPESKASKVRWAAFKPEEDAFSDYDFKGTSRKRVCHGLFTYHDGNKASITDTLLHPSCFVEANVRDLYYARLNAKNAGHNVEDQIAWMIG